MGVLKYYEDIARNEGRVEGLAEGRAEGLAEGGYLMLWKLVRNGILSMEEAAKSCQMTEEEFLKVKPTEA